MMGWRQTERMWSGTPPARTLLCKWRWTLLNSVPSARTSRVAERAFQLYRQPVLAVVGAKSPEMSPIWNERQELLLSCPTSRLSCFPTRRISCKGKIRRNGRRSSCLSFPAPAVTLTSRRDRSAGATDLREPDGCCGKKPK
jgi:hypothetical protein